MPLIDEGKKAVDVNAAGAPSVAGRDVATPDDAVRAGIAPADAGWKYTAVTWYSCPSETVT